MVNSLNTDARPAPFPPFPTPIASLPSMKSSTYSRQYAHSTIGYHVAKKRKCRQRSKRQWKSSGENDSASSKSDQFVDPLLTLSSKNIFLGEKTNDNKQKNYLINSLKYNSTTQIKSYSPNVIRDIRKKPSSAFDLDRLSGSPYRESSTRTTKIISRIEDDFKESKKTNNRKIDKDNVSREIFLNGQLVEESQGKKSSSESCSPFHSVGGLECNGLNQSLLPYASKVLNCGNTLERVSDIGSLEKLNNSFEHPGSKFSHDLAHNEMVLIRVNDTKIEYL